MTEETKTEDKIEKAPEDTKPTETTESTKTKTKTKATKAKAEDIEEPKTSEDILREDPTLSRLLAAERRLEELSSELEKSKAQVKSYEREGRKSSILSSLADAFPGLPRDEIRGAALVAAEDGRVDLYSSDAAAQVEKMKEILKAKKTTAPQPSLGGTPGSQGKPQQTNNVRNRFPI